MPDVASVNYHCAKQYFRFLTALNANRYKPPLGQDSTVDDGLFNAWI